MLAFQFLSYRNVTKTSFGLTEAILTKNITKLDYHVMWLPSYDLPQCLQHTFGYIPSLQGLNYYSLLSIQVYTNEGLYCILVKVDADSHLLLLVPVCLQHHSCQTASVPQ